MIALVQYHREAESVCWVGQRVKILAICRLVDEGQIDVVIRICVVLAPGASSSFSISENGSPLASSLW